MRLASWTANGCHAFLPLTDTPKRIAGVWSLPGCPSKAFVPQVVLLRPSSAHDSPK
jgi:hypothetical protein